MIIAVDGPAASGKGTLARKLAKAYGLAYMDTGALYRAVARDLLAAGARLDDHTAAEQAARAIEPASLDDPGLRSRGLGEAASVVAGIPAVRAALLDVQRNFARRPEGAVLDGRDIGTVVCPDADVKLYVTATPQVRAQRRHAELVAAGEDISLASVLAMIEARDARDRERTSSPLRPADDAALLDTSVLDIEAAFDAAIGLIKRKIGQRGCV
ncbi:MAG: d(CMP) kinase [Hyphomicrobiaceae bacterium]